MKGSWFKQDNSVILQPFVVEDHPDPVSGDWKERGAAESSEDDNDDLDEQGKAVVDVMARFRPPSEQGF